MSSEHWTPLQSGGTSADVLSMNYRLPLTAAALYSLLWVVIAAQVVVNHWGI